MSDFGLTRLKEEVVKGNDTHGGMGSVYWMAPEVLNAEPNIDYALADVPPPEVLTALIPNQFTDYISRRCIRSALCCGNF